MTTIMKSQTTNNCANVANLCCPSNNSQTAAVNEKNGVPKKIVKVIDPHTNGVNREMNGKGPLRSPPPPKDLTSTTNTADLLSKMKIIDDESTQHGIKLTDVGLPHISVQTVECKKDEKPQTTIIIYKSKNGNRAPTAKVIMTKVLNTNLSFRVYFRLTVSSLCL
jgi:hypothetical protein